jgi:hypothetical protein
MPNQFGLIVGQKIAIAPIVIVDAVVNGLYMLVLCVVITLFALEPSNVEVHRLNVHRKLGWRYEYGTA